MTQTLLTQQIDIDVAGNQPFVLSLSLRRAGKTHRVEIEHNASGLQLRILEAASPGETGSSMVAANRTRRISREEALQALVEFFERNPGGSYREASQVVGRSKSWMTGAVKDLEKAGRIRRSSDGIQVLKKQTNKTLRMNALLEAYEKNPEMSIADAARMLCLHRNTIHNYLNELEEAGHIQRNGDGVEVLAR